MGYGGTAVTLIAPQDLPGAGGGPLPLQSLNICALPNGAPVHITHIVQQLPHQQLSIESICNHLLRMSLVNQRQGAGVRGRSLGRTFRR